MTKPLFGLVLSGGKSSRMGQDKGGLRYHDGVPQTAHLYALLSQYCSQVFVSIRTQQRRIDHYKDFPVIADSADIGPMGGLAAAFEHERAAWLLVAVDLPSVTTETLGALVAARDAATAQTTLPAAAVVAFDAFAFMNPGITAPDPMCAIYEPAIVPLMNQHIAAQQYGLRRLLERANTNALEPINNRQFDNVNTPQEYTAQVGRIEKISNQKLGGLYETN